MKTSPVGVFSQEPFAVIVTVGIGVSSIVKD